jgi:hypothetical protein
VLSGDVDVTASVCASLRRYRESEKRKGSERRLSTYEEDEGLASFFPGKGFGAGPEFVDCFGRAFTSGLRDIVKKLYA